MEQTSLFEQYFELKLKPLQEYSLNEVRKAFSKSKRIIYQAACGMGKTILSAQIAKNAVEKGKTVLFIADRIVLCNQTSDVFNRYNIKHGVIQAQNERFDISQPVQICSIQTLKTRGCPENADVIIIDECHVLYSEHKNIIKNNPQAFVLGLTATPYAKGLGKYFDFHIQPVPIKELIEKDYLVPFDIYGPTIADLSKLKVMAGEYTEKSNVAVFDKADIIGNVVDMWKKLTPGKKTIAFGANIDHIKNMAKQFQDAGISACQINAYQSDEERAEALSSFTEGDTTVLCSVEVATKGFDCPKAEVCVLAVATKSIIKWTQTTGRVLRVFPGKERATVLDFGGNAERLGFPDDFVFTQLDDGKKKEASEKKEKLPKACPSCDFIKPVGVHTCPACGFTPKKVLIVEEAEGELAKLQRKAKKEWTIDEKQEWLAQINQYVFEKGWKPGKAIHEYKEKFGVVPSSKINWWARSPVGEEVRNYMTYKLIKWVKGNQKARAHS